MTSSTQLKPTLGTLHLWGIAVGLVISGEYFGWSYGWGIAGTLGFLVTSLMVATMYTCFIFSFTELTTAIPHAGGPFAYSRRAFGEKGGLIAGIATLIEFVFAPPAIAMAIGAYLNVQFPALDPKHRRRRRLHRVHGPEYSRRQHRRHLRTGGLPCWPSPNCWCSWAWSRRLQLQQLRAQWLVRLRRVRAPAIAGMFAAIPFAIWFFLAIEGAAMAAEEAKDPKRTIPKAYISGILTLVFLAMGVMFLAGGVGDWRHLSNINDPLPQAMKAVVGENSAGCTCWCGSACSAWWRVSTGSSSATRASSSPWPAPVTCRASWPNCRASRPRTGRSLPAA